MELKANTTADQFKIIEDQKDEPDLKAAQDFVGGMVQGIQFPNGDYMIMNEEGKLLNLPLNPEATRYGVQHSQRISIYLDTTIGYLVPQSL